MGTAQTRKTNRRRQRKIAKYLRDREREPQFPLPANIADGLGDLPPGQMVTAREYARCLARLEDILAGRIKRSTRNERLGVQNAKQLGCSDTKCRTITPLVR
jgi:hypothetical protein